MKAVGIVGEYNPFHWGHAYHIRETRRLLGEDTAVVCVLSGDFVQRGAEGLARGAVGLLGALGVVGHLSFGSERGEIEPLNALAVALLDGAMPGKIRAELESGVSYAAARQRVLEREVGDLARLLETPNNILAVEYLKALYTLGLSLEPVTVLRAGPGHDEAAARPHRFARKEPETLLRSASELRAMLSRGEDVSQSVPLPALALYRRQMDSGRGPVTDEALESAILSRLRQLPDAAFDALPDATEGLGARLRLSARTEPTLEAVLAGAKTKRYALSRLRRMTLSAALGVSAGMAEGTPPYARLLACTERGRALLREAEGRARLPILTKPAAVRELGPDARSVFALTAAARDLYVLGYAARAERRGGSDWRMGPAVLPD